MNEIRENTQETIVTAPEIFCGGCANSIKKALGNVAGISEVNVDVETKKVSVSHAENVSRKQIIEALDRAGYEAS